MLEWSTSGCGSVCFCCCSVAKLCLTLCSPWTAAHQTSLSITNSQSLLKLMSIKSLMPSNHIILYCPLLLQPSIFPGSGSFLMSQLFISGGQSIRASASTFVIPMNIQNWFPLHLPGWISLLSKGLSTVFSNTNSSVLNFLYDPTLAYIHDYQKNHSFD